MSDPIFHIATAADWRRARRTGTYATSTRGRTLEQEGFIHACHRSQVADVFGRYYADAGEPLVLLAIDRERLGAEVREEAVGEATYPHVYGPIPRRAVLHATPLAPDGATDGLFRLFLRELFGRMAVAVWAMVCLMLGVVVAGALGGPVVQLVGAGVGLALGVLSGVLVARRV